MRQVPQSGAGVVKLDVSDRSLVISAKHTDDQSFRVTADMLAEMKAAISGVGGVGAGSTTILAVQIGGIDRRVVVIDFEDFIALLESDETYVPPTKDSQRRARASVPSLLRDDR